MDRSETKVAMGVVTFQKFRPIPCFGDFRSNLCFFLTLVRFCRKWVQNLLCFEILTIHNCLCFFVSDAFNLICNCIENRLRFVNTWRDLHDRDYVYMTEFVWQFVHVCSTLVPKYE